MKLSVQTVIHGLEMIMSCPSVLGQKNVKHFHQTRTIFLPSRRGLSVIRVAVKAASRGGILKVVFNHQTKKATKYGRNSELHLSRDQVAWWMLRLESALIVTRTIDEPGFDGRKADFS